MNMIKSFIFIFQRNNIFLKKKLSYTNLYVSICNLLKNFKGNQYLIGPEVIYLLYQ